MNSALTERTRNKLCSPGFVRYRRTERDKPISQTPRTQILGSRFELPSIRLARSVQCRSDANDISNVTPR